MMRRLFFAIIVMTLTCVGAMAQVHQMKTVGQASYYHNNLHGLRMANGERYHRDSMTCAHLRFPLGTMLRVTNVHTGKSVEVEVTDRGPYSNRFVVDLSRRAARELGIIGSKHINVVLTPVGDAHIPFRIAKSKAEEEDSHLYDMQPYGENPEYVWEGDSILRRALDEMQDLKIEKIE